MQQLNIALAVLKQGDKYLLQRHSDTRKVDKSNSIGWFGGKNESETSVEAVCREVAEETTLTPKPEDATLLGHVEVTSDHVVEGVVINAAVFKIDVDPKVDVKAREGELIALTHEEALKQLSEMTVSTAATFRQLLRED